MTVLKVLIVVGRAHVWLGEGVKNSQPPYLTLMDSSLQSCENSLSGGALVSV